VPTAFFNVDIVSFLAAFLNLIPYLENNPVSLVLLLVSFPKFDFEFYQTLCLFSFELIFLVQE